MRKHIPPNGKFRKIIFVKSDIIEYFWCDMYVSSQEGYGPPFFFNLKNNTVDGSEIPNNYLGGIQ